MKPTYYPGDEIIQRYADLMVNFGLRNGQGMRPGDVVYCIVPEWARPMYRALQLSIVRGGGHSLMEFLPVGLDAELIEQSSLEQLGYFPKAYRRGFSKVVDGAIYVYPFEGPRDLQGVDPEKLMARDTADELEEAWLQEKETNGLFSWTLCTYGVQEYAEDVGLTLEEYWGHIIKACYLEDPDPVKQWRKVTKEIQRVARRLNKLGIEKVHVEGVDVDLWITIGPKRKFVYAPGSNMPAYEIYTSPDWRGTNGWIRFNQPLYYNGTVITDIRLEFKNGKVVRAEASSNLDVLLEMLKEKDANKLGEFSLTDGRFSHITHGLGDTLYMENMGGRYGNTHIALGACYTDTYDGDASILKARDWKSLGFNNQNASVHVDIISTADRVVTAYCFDGSVRVIYKDGKFVI
jgi:aminopeptidase